MPLSPQLRAALLAIGVDKRPRDQEAALSSWRRPWGQDGIWAMLQATFRRCKLPRHRLPALRAYFVIALLNGRMPVHVVSALAGHEDFATTQKYAEVLNADKGAAVGVLGRAHEAGREQRDAKLVPEPPRAGAQRVKKSKARGSLLRSRAMERARQRGNTLETEPIAAE